MMSVTDGMTQTGEFFQDIRDTLSEFSKHNKKFEIKLLKKLEIIEKALTKTDVFIEERTFKIVVFDLDTLVLESHTDRQTYEDDLEKNLKGFPAWRRHILPQRPRRFGQLRRRPRCRSPDHRCRSHRPPRRTTAAGGPNDR